jgi:E3 SUMO-protein ligase NSE2
VGISLPCDHGVSLSCSIFRTICQHSFSAEAIRQVLGPNKFTKKKCPVSGCNQMISLNDLKPDKDMARRVKACQRRAQRREEEHDVEEIVE